MSRMFNPPHPGEILREEYITPLGLSVPEVAGKLGVTQEVLSSILHERSGISTEMALRLAKAFNNTPESWLDMQMQYDLFHCKSKTSLDNVDVLFG